MFFHVIFLSLCCVLCLAVQNLEGPLVQLPQGLVQGTYQHSYKNRTYSAFEGIPYGKPPVGNLRFEEPQPADGWGDTLVASKHYECLHFMPFPILFGPRGTEDCLYMYVYVPRQKINSNELLDVVVHIHGGAFMLGAPKYMAGPQFLMDQDVVFVSFNYRLGILGFLSTEDNVVPGNNGLKDQSLALEWIKKNIKYFGGNPASITLTGLSAGGASVHFHYLSPLSKGLFHRGFSQSGTALNCWALTETPLTHAQVVAKNISCPTSSTKEMVDCLKTTDDIKLIHGIRSLFVYMDIIPFTTFGPVIEYNSKNPFLNEHPYTLLKEGRVYDVPWINSNVKDEGLFPVGCAPHGDDGRLIFKMFGTPTILTESDEKMMELFTGFIASFAKTGIPLFNTSNWKPVTPGQSNIDYVHIGDADSISMKTTERLAPNDFWQSLPIAEVESAIVGSANVLCSNFMILSTLTALIIVYIA